ncbi:site-specific integrase [Methylopila sp. M107]|uniref:tyrosine-type recombinase/integrase n=1 Tax=Methylopila sp. M107 TaxID=1101190 RepID=UPI0004784F55|nr:site-specific integrase [Methylopila sp. M107]
MNRLSARSVATAPAGRHADGGNLYLLVTTTGAKSWLLIFRHDGRQREMGLGAVRSVSLARARELAAAARAQLSDGIDPIEARRQSREEASRASRRVPTFGEAADQIIESMESGWRNSKHRAQWRMTLGRARDPEGELTGEGYCLALADKPVNEVTTADVLAVLRPIWSEKAETASRVRGRIEAVLNAAKAEGFRSGENPALWRGHLDRLLAKRQKLQRGHHRALAYEDLPAFVADLRGRDGVAPLALEFAILTASRTGEVLGARRSEFDLDRRLWSIPAARMKAGRSHRVPLVERAVEILAELEPLRRDASTPDAVMFPSPRRSNEPLSNMALATVLKRMDYSVTTHGFRSTFRDWAGDQTNFAREVVEAALAHSIRDATEAAYRRQDALEKRRELMNAWARYAAPSTVEAD